MFGNHIAKIEKMAAKKDSDGIAKFLDDKNKDVVLAAVKALGQAGGEAAFNNLVTLLRSPDAALRIASAEALAELKDSKAAAFVSHCIEEETDPAVKTAMSKTLSVLHDEKI